MPHFRRAFRLAVLSLSVTFLALATPAQTSTFTYQGKLTDASAPANGTYQMQFALFDQAGTQIGSAIENTAVTVTNGVFTVQLDFGPARFPGVERLLEVRVRRTSADAYVTLTPRERITSTPYAIRALTAGTADNISGQLGDDHISDTLTVGPGGTVSDGALSANVPRNNLPNTFTADQTVNGVLSATTVNSQTQYNINSTPILSSAGLNNLFVGIGAGAVNAGQNNTFIGLGAGNKNTTSSGNSFLGYNAGSENTTGTLNSFVGSAAGQSNTTGFYNVFFGASAGKYNTTGAQNSFVGLSAGRDSTGGSNAFFGFSAGLANLAGSNNTAIGSSANVGSSGLNYATAIGSDAVVSSSNTIALGRNGGQDTVQIPGPATANGTVRVGASNLAGCDLILADDICFYDEQNGTLSIRNFAGTAYATARAAGFVNASSIDYKKDVTPLGAMQHSSMLRSLLNLPIYTYRYRSESDSSRLHTGLIAERSPATLLTADGKGVDLYDFITLNAGATKALASQVEQLSKENAAQKLQLSKQQAQIDELIRIVGSSRHKTARAARRGK